MYKTFIRYSAIVCFVCLIEYMCNLSLLYSLKISIILSKLLRFILQIIFTDIFKKITKDYVWCIHKWFCII